MKIIIISLLLPLLASAQKFVDDPSHPNSKVIRQEGQLVSIQLVLGEPLRIFVVGREEAKLDFSDLKVTVRRLKPYPGKVLSVDRHNNYFSVSESLDLKKRTDLEVTTKVKGKTETLRFKIENKLP